MKTARFILKIVALALTTAAAVCCVVAFWDKIMEGVGAAANKPRSRSPYADSGYIDDDDYSDWDE